VAATYDYVFPDYREPHHGAMAKRVGMQCPDRKVDIPQYLHTIVLNEGRKQGRNP